MASQGTRIVAASGPAPTGSAGETPVPTTPMMDQYWRAKKEAPGSLVFFRMGDFYELFHEDAVTASRALGLTLTSRSKGSDPIPMAGVPVRSVEAYLLRLVRGGHKVAICEQLEDPRAAKGIVERGIVRVVTPGTLTEEDGLDARAPNFLASLWLGREQAGLSWIDLSTGRMLGCEILPEQCLDELARLRPAELLHPRGLFEEHPEWKSDLAENLSIALSERDDWRFEREGALRTLTRHFGTKNLEGFGIETRSALVPAAGALLEYAAETQRAACSHILRIEKVSRDEVLVLDRATRASLELVATSREGRREGTLLETIDATLTPMGSRLLREWVLNPLRKVPAILRRQHGVGELVHAPFLREEIRELLDDVRDVERLAGKLATGRALARDLVALGKSLAVVPRLRAKLGASPAPLPASVEQAPSVESLPNQVAGDLGRGVHSRILLELALALDPLEDVSERIAKTLVDEPPLALQEGGLVRERFSSELDELRSISGDAKSWMARFQAEESQRSGIPGLKIGFNSVFGYFIEVPRGQLGRVPQHFIRKQTIKNAERYVTPELKDLETKVLKAEELARDLEYQIFVELRDAVATHVKRILDTARAIAELDALAGLAQVAAENRYVAPVVDEEHEIRIIEGRHPVLERSSACATFVPNDAILDLAKHRITILTGPNMAGKSTYIRQVALTVLMAQIGSFVPAQEARIGVVDRIFTRVGAGDDISRGESTFMVEMVEIANILNNASQRSLVILDEVGRGTSTFDGLALAWAIAEHLHEKVGCRTLFATHYHQLTDLSSRYSGVVNKNVAVREWGDEIVFLHKIVDGGTDRSYGIHVARLAGVPQDVLARARGILADLERDEEGLAQRILAQKKGPGGKRGSEQLSLFAPPPSEVEIALKKLDLDSMAPIDALVALRDLKRKLEERS